MFPDRHESYSIAVLDITPSRPVRYAAYQEDRRFSPGSVGKVAVISGLFAELRRLYPDSPEQRRELLKTRIVTADRWINVDRHDVPLYDPVSGGFDERPIREGDRFSLFEWADHMMSASANAAASTVWKEAILMRAFGSAYPPSPSEEREFFARTSKGELQRLAVSIVNDPFRAVGITDADWRLGTMFTSAGKSIVPGMSSYGTPRGLLQFLVAVESGRIVDEWSSLEIKRLMYMTAKRIRYASSPALNSASVCFKSGSLYKCKPEPGFTCKKYHGNVENAMNSIAIVERPDGSVYLVALMSDVLRKNSAVDHQRLATEIDALLK